MKKMLIIIGAILLVFFTAAVIILPPWTNFPNILYDENGNEIDGSVSEKRLEDINGTKLGMFIKGESSDKPVLLFLGGGPGLPEYLLEDMYPTGLEKQFIVCCLEYRGTSLSYTSETTSDTMTTEQYLSDVNEVTEYLKKRFNKEKIYLMGHSFGSYIGINAAKQHPEQYYAYIGMSQISDQYKSEVIAYNYMIDEYRKTGNESMAEALESCNLTLSDDLYNQYFEKYRDKAMHELGVGTCHDMNSVITGIFFPSLRCVAYTPLERIRIWQGKAAANGTSVQKDAFSFNGFEKIDKLEIPIYFFGGVYDYTCCYTLQKEYYDYIEAPDKEFYSFENSAHSPLFEESDKAMEILKAIVEKNEKQN